MDDPATATAVHDSDGLHVAGPTAPTPVFSVTKLFVATAVLRLTETAELDLDAEAAHGATVRELLGHQGGLPDYATTPAYLDAVAAAPGNPWGVEEIAYAAGEPSTRGRFSYSNLGYWLLGALVEQVTGKSLAVALAELVFTPAGLTDTWYPARGEGRTESGYSTLWAGPAGAAWSTPADLVAFLGVLTAGSLITPESFALMGNARPVESGGPPWQAPGYGLGVMVDRELGVLGHAGAGPQYTSAAFTLLDGSRSAAAIAGPGARTDPTTAVLRLLSAGGPGTS